MKTILVFSTLTGKDRRALINGIRSFAAGTDWNLQVQEFNGRPFPAADLIRFWNPVGCIVESNGNGVTRKTLPYRVLQKIPTVYIGRNPLVVPARASIPSPGANGLDPVLWLWGHLFAERELAAVKHDREAGETNGGGIV